MKLKLTLLSALIVAGFSLFAQEIPLPENYEIVTSTLGDLDKDSINELVVVYNTKVVNKDADDYDFESIPRELRIYKLENGEWINWHKSDQALKGSEDGGMMIDPLDNVEIKNGILIITHFGGARWTWSITDKYRYQDCGFYLIGYTSYLGARCEYSKTVDFNLSTGKIITYLNNDDCEEEDSLHLTYEDYKETFYAKGHKIKMEFRRDRSLILLSPNQREIFIE